MNTLSKINDFINRINKKVDPTRVSKEQVGGINKAISKINQRGYALTKINPKFNVNQDQLFDPIGILDPEGKKNNPLTGEPYQNLYVDAKEHPGTYADNSGWWTNLPVYKKRDEVIKEIYQNRVLLITAGTGSGKTVLAPKFALHVLGYKGKVAITNPKKIPTKIAATSSAVTLDVELGKQVGYVFRGERKTSEDTKLLYCTDGILVARMSGTDPNLEDLDIVIVDEAHERNVQIDLLLAQLKSLLLRRDDFRVIIMSATIDPKVFVDYFTTDKFKCKWIEPYSGTSNLPIKELYYPNKPINIFNPDGTMEKGDYIAKAVEVIVECIMKKKRKGDILVFLTGKREGQDACKLLMTKIAGLGQKPFCTLLHGGSTEKEIKWALSLDYMDDNKIPGGPYDRRIVMATEAVESSVNFTGTMDFIIDAGLAKMDTFYPKKMLGALEQRYISKASHKQRRGRTGRIAPGTCYNLFTEEEFRKFKDFTNPPILVSDLTGNVLSFMGSKFISHVDIPFIYETKKVEVLKVEDISLNQLLGGMITQPDPVSITMSIKVLYALGAVEFKGHQGVLTTLGRAMKEFRGLRPEMAKSILRAYLYKVRDDVIAIAAMVEAADDRIDNFFPKFFSKKREGSPEYKKEQGNFRNKRAKWVSPYGDHLSMLKVYKAMREVENEWKQKMRLMEPEEIKAEEATEVGIILEGNDEGKKEEGERDPREKKMEYEIRKWCEYNTINYKTINKANRGVNDYKRIFRRVVQDYPELFQEEVIVSEKEELNILRALLDGNFINLAIEKGRSYQTCFPTEQVTGNIDSQSMLLWKKTAAKYIMTSPTRSILGRIKFNMVSKIPDAMIKEIPKVEQGYLDKCLAPGKVMERGNKPKPVKKRK